MLYQFSESIQRMDNEAINNAQQDADDAGSKSVRSLQLLRAGSFQFGIFADEIASIVGWREPTPLPYAPQTVLGVLSIQGRMLTVLDLARLRGLEGVLSDRAAQNIVALRGDEQLALAVDASGETIQLAGLDLDKAEKTREALVPGVLHREGTDIYLLNVKEVFPTAIQGHERRRRRF